MKRGPRLVALDRGKLESRASQALLPQHERFSTNALIQSSIATPFKVAKLLGSLTTLPVRQTHHIFMADWLC